jgi:hypothetical protein
VLVGDDFSGDCVGYDTKSGWTIGEIDHTSGRFHALDGVTSDGVTSFVWMIEERFLGNDPGVQT